MSQTKMYQGCLFFLTGVVLALGYDDLSKNKVASQSTTSLSSNDDFIASKAVDRDITTCMRAEVIGTTSAYTYKTIWWKVDLGGVYSIYSVNILFKNYDGFEKRQQGRFAGFSIYVSSNGLRDNSSLCYKDGPKLPALNFMTTCITSGRYVTFYNERLPGVKYPDGYVVDHVYTELCEVTVHGCQASGVYGEDCKKLCPTNCRNNVCHIQKGTCFGCASGWMDTTCNTKCVGGWYGLDCKQLCSGHCKDNAVCNHVTGQCDIGCAAGWRGALCDKVCEDGTYGSNCVHNCSGNCFNDSTCNKETGHCIACNPGYTNALCNKECLSGYFGARCNKTCSGHCLKNSTCHPIDGTCLSGCQDGFMGNLCNASCNEGYYGRNCSRTCPSNCKVCKATDGTCSCYAGWMGPKCSIGCVWTYGEDCRYPCGKHCVNQTCDRFNGSCLSGCDNGFHGEKCDQKYGSTTSVLSTVSSGILGASVSACVFFTAGIVIPYIWRKRFCFSGKPSNSNKESHYAEIENQLSGAPTYQELTVSKTNKEYENLELQ